MRYNYGPSPTSVVIFLFSIIAVGIIIFVVIKMANEDTGVTMRTFSSSGNSGRGSILERLYQEQQAGMYGKRKYDDDDDDDWDSGYDGYINGHYVGSGSTANNKYRVGTDDDDHVLYDYSSLFA